MAKGATGGHGFSAAPVFLAAISTILGTILFLRFGYAVGHAGLMGAVLIVLIGHMVTIPTALAVSEIATNLRVEGGGEYYIISRSFGATVGGTIGISLYFSQAISVSFYLIAFAEAFRPLFPLIEQYIGMPVDPRFISIPAAVLLVGLILVRGANIGVGLLWVVASVLAVSLVMFFLGGTTQNAPEEITLFGKVENPDSFMRVFAIIFPAFTGMTMGVGLSGDLREPRKAIPLGTLAASVAGLVVYLLLAVKLTYSASPERLAGDQFIMADLAVWGPIIPIGLGAATLSSAIGSVLVAPRTLQALGRDSIFPHGGFNRMVRSGKGKSKEPFNATLITAVVIFAFVAAGSVDFVAQIISMFFMITYGALCAISFLEHFGGNPSYRPTFRTRWYISLLGAVAALVLMFLMSPLYATGAMIVMVIIYTGLKRSRDGERSLSVVLQGVLLQFTRFLRVTAQKKQPAADYSGWRPSVVAISSHSLERLAPFDMLRWLSHHYGFGTFLHYLEGPLTVSMRQQADRALKRLIVQAQESDAGLYVDTIISPSFSTAVAQVVQLPGIAGMNNNSVLFEFEAEDDQELATILDSIHFPVVSGFNVCLLRSSDRHFGYKQSIHIWITPGDYRNVNLMILLAYILLGHPEWRDAEIKLFDSYTQDDEKLGDQKAEDESGENGEQEKKKKQQGTERQTDTLDELIREGRLPISPKNVMRVSRRPDVHFDELVAEISGQADLVITGFSVKKAIRQKGRYLLGFRGVNDILFVRASQDILITSDAGEDFDEIMEEEELLTGELEGRADIESMDVEKEREKEAAKKAEAVAESEVTLPSGEIEDEGSDPMLRRVTLRGDPGDEDEGVEPGEDEETDTD